MMDYKIMNSVYGKFIPSPFGTVRLATEMRKHLADAPISVVRRCRQRVEVKSLHESSKSLLRCAQHCDVIAGRQDMCGHGISQIVKSVCDPTL